MKLTQILQHLFLGWSFTPEGNRIARRKVFGLTITGKKYLKEVIREVPEIGEELYHAYYSMGKRRPYAEWVH